MASRYRWRQQLLGSLQGQLQLATYLIVEYASQTGSLIPINKRHISWYLPRAGAPKR